MTYLTIFALWCVLCLAVVAFGYANGQRKAPYTVSTIAAAAMLSWDLFRDQIPSVVYDAGLIVLGTSVVVTSTLSLIVWWKTRRGQEC